MSNICHIWITCTIGGIFISGTYVAIICEEDAAVGYVLALIHKHVASSWPCCMRALRSISVICDTYLYSNVC